jgi:radical SAM superfamily enzyme YgiQ (UPF0313 family)
MKKILLINPWIYDFTAYDLWSKPLGLLYIASFLRKQGYDVHLIDCLEKSSSVRKGSGIKRYGTGKYDRTIVAKPQVLSHIPRFYARYGISEDDFIRRLKDTADYDAVLVTSIMTYWYPGVQLAVELCRKHLPQVPVILGGIYASLMPQHAKEFIKADYLVEGPGELQVLTILKNIAGEKVDTEKLPKSIDDYPFPAFDLLAQVDYLPIMTSRGCPYNCTFCAQKLISMPFVQRTPDSVVEEFGEHYQRFKRRDFAFYDDALFIKRDSHIKTILAKLIDKKLPLRLHSPNGLFAKYVDREMAELMYRSSFKTVRLSFETSNEERRKDMQSKVTNEDIINAVEYLVQAGYKAKDLESYVLMGLPGQSVEEIIASMIFVHNLGIQIRLASFSPIPGTVEYERAVDDGLIEKDMDPLLTNKTIFPLHKNPQEYQMYRKIRMFSHILNYSLQRGLIMFDKSTFTQSVKKVVSQL